MRANRKLLEVLERAIVAENTLFAIVFASVIASMFSIARGIVFHDLPLSRHLILRTDQHQMRQLTCHVGGVATLGETLERLA
jgi:hypothetical protein